MSKRDRTQKDDCIVKVNDYRCLCAAGFTGKNCEVDINECETNPCLNNGTCTDGFNNYTCSCTSRLEDFLTSSLFNSQN